MKVASKLRHILKVASKLGENEIGKVKLDESKGEVKLCEFLGKSLPIYLQHVCFPGLLMLTLISTIVLDSSNLAYVV